MPVDDHQNPSVFGVLVKFFSASTDRQLPNNPLALLELIVGVIILVIEMRGFRCRQL